MIKKSESQARRTEADAALMELHEVVLNVLKEVEDAFGIERDLAVQSRALKIAPPYTSRKKAAATTKNNIGKAYIQFKACWRQKNRRCPCGFDKMRWWQSVCPIVLIWHWLKPFQGLRYVFTVLFIQ
jgi:hypothetical protein